jgi:enoyl-CoA hydratase/carnithine racemase
VADLKLHVRTIAGRKTANITLHRKRRFAQKTVFAEQPPQAIINTKALLKAKNHDAVAAIMKAEFEIFSMALQSEEAMEAFMKFMSKKGK